MPDATETTGGPEPRQDSGAQTTTEPAMATTSQPDSGSGIARWWRARRRWQRRLMVAIPTAVLLYTLAGFFGVPLVIRHIVVPQIGKRMNGSIALRDAQCNPYTFFLGLDGLDMRDAQDRKAIAFERFEADFELWRSLFRSGWHFQHLLLDQPLVGLHRAADGTSNLGNLFKPDPEPKDSEPLKRIPHLVVDAFDLREGTVSIDDLSLPEPFNTVIGGITLGLERIDTSPEYTNTTNLVATTETGARLEWKGTFELDPFSSTGTIVATQLHMPRFMPYAMSLLEARVVEGRLDFTLNYDFEPVHQPRLALFTFPSIVAHEVQVQHHDQPLIGLPLLEIEELSLNATSRHVEGRAIRLHDGSLLARRDPEGRLNIASIVVAAAEDAPPAAPADPGGRSATDGPGASPAARVDPTDIEFPVQQLLTALSYLLEDAIGPWSVDIDELTIANQSIDVVDDGVAPAVRVPLRGTALRAGPIRSEDRFLIPFTASTKVFESGQIDTGGSLGVLDRTLDATLRAERIELVSAAPYLALVLSPPLDVPTLRSGLASLDLRMKANATDPEATSVELTGPVHLEVAEVVRAEDGVPLVSAQSTALDGTMVLTTRPGGGVGGSWSGTFSARDINGGEPLMRALGLGDGGVTMASVAVTGRSAASRDGDGSGRLEWEGAVTIEGIDGDGLALAGPTDVESDRIDLEGRAETSAGSDGRTTVTWSGKVQSREGHLVSRSANVDASLGDMLLDGAATATLAPGAEQRVEWKGALTATGATATLADVTRAALRSLESTGALVTTIRPDEVAVDWRGRMATMDAAIEGPDWSTSAGSLSVDGVATVNQGGPEAVGWTGLVDLGSVSLRTTLAGGAEARSDRLRLDGALSSPSDTLESLAWKGQVELARPVVTASAAGGPASLQAESLRIDGTTSLDRGGSGMLEHAGTVDLAGAVLRAEGVASGLDGSLRTVRIDGTLRAQPLLDAPHLIWNGTLASANADIGAGAGPLEVSLTSFDARGTLGLDSGAGGLDWDGTVALGGAAGVAGGSKIDLGGAEATGALAAGLAGDAPIDWKGTLVASDARAAASDGSSSFGAGRIVHDGGATLVRRAAPDPADLGATGSLSIEQVAAQVGATALDIPTVKVDGIDLRNDADTLALASIAVTSPVIRTEVSMGAPNQIASEVSAQAPDQVPSRDAESASGAQAQPPLAPAARGEALAAKLPYRVALGTFTLSDGRIEMVDVKAQPPTTSALDQIDITATNVATDGSAMTDLSASARLQGSGRFDATGKANVFENPPSGDITVTLSHVPMPPYSPLSGRFAGFMIDAGRLDVTLPITVDAGKVKGQLDFLMDQLKLGQKVKSPDAPNIPLDLGLALLRDPNDQIKGSVPFSGDMSSPEFSFGGLIWQAVLSLMGKIVTAPFQLIAGAFAGGQDLDLSFIAFAPGSADLDGDALKKLDVLAKGLTERPQIRLDASGRMAREADIAAIRPNLLREEARKRLQSSFPDVKVVPDDVYRQIVISKHAELPAEKQVPRLPNGDAPPFDQVERTVLGTMEVTDEMLRDLALRRAEAIKSMLTTEKGIAPERVTASVPEGAEAESSDPRADLQIGS